MVKVIQELETTFGIELNIKEMDCAESNEQLVYIIDGVVVAMELEREHFLTLKGILRFHPRKRHVVVDEGAVRFLYNGADVMCPGIVDADPDIRKWDMVWVKEISHGQPLVVGMALTTGEEMVESTKGKAVKTMHYLNDPLWNIEFK